MRRNISRSGLARRNRQQRYAIRAWTDRLVDCPAFIIGNSPSTKDANLSLLEDYFTIGINRCFHLFDPTILIWQDISLWNTEYQRLHNIQAIKVARDVSDPRRIYYNFHLKGGAYKFDKSKTHILYGRGSTGPLAIQLAVSLGCSKIIMIGMDCQVGEDGKTDFWGTNKHWTENTIPNCQRGLEFIKEQCPVEVRNCGNASFWPKEELEDVLEGIDRDIHGIGRQAYVKRLLKINN